MKGLKIRLKTIRNFLIQSLMKIASGPNIIMEVPGTPIGASFFEFDLNPTGKDSADPT